MTKNHTQLAAEAADVTTPPLRLQRLAKHVTLARIVAANRATPPEALTWLGQRGDDAVKAAVAANPNTPTAMLLALAEQFPQAFAGNPVVPLLLLEDPGAFSTLSDDFAWRVIADPKAPRELLFVLQGHAIEWVRHAASLHVAINGEAGAGWANEAQHAFAHLPLILSPLISDVFISTFIQNAPLTIPTWLLEAMAAHDDEEVRSAVANYPACPAEMLTRLAKDRSARVRRTVGYHPYIPAALQRLFAHDSDDYMRRAILWHTDLAVDLLIQLADDPSDFVREGVAQHPYVPMDQLLVLARDVSARVRTGAAQQTRLPSAMLAELAGDADERVRLWTACNPSLAPATLERLAGDASAKVREYAAKNPAISVQLLDQLARDDTYFPRLGVALNPNTPVYILEWLAHDSWDIVRANVARHRHMPLAELERLVEDSDEWVRINVAGNPGISPPLIQRLRQEASPRLLSWLANNMTTPCDVAWDLAQQHAEVCLNIAERTDLDETMRAQIAPLALTLVLRESPPDAIFRITLVLASPLLPSAILAEHAERQLHWLPLYAIARNPNTPPATLQRLAQGANRLVRAAARARQAEV